MILTLVVGKVDFAGNSLLRIFRTDTEMRRFLFLFFMRKRFLWIFCKICCLKCDFYLFRHFILSDFCKVIHSPYSRRIFIYKIDFLRSKLYFFELSTGFHFVLSGYNKDKV